MGMDGVRDGGCGVGGVGIDECSGELGNGSHVLRTARCGADEKAIRKHSHSRKHDSSKAVNQKHKSRTSTSVVHEQ